VIIVKQAKNHVEQLKKTINFVTHIYMNIYVTLMSMLIKEFCVKWFIWMLKNFLKKNLSQNFGLDIFKLKYLKFKIPIQNWGTFQNFLSMKKSR
jgi:hypothetical protein